MLLRAEAWRWLVPVLALVLALTIAPASVGAADLRSGENVTVPATEQVDQDLYVGGTNIRIDGRVNGDVYLAGRTVVVNGPVSGNIVAIGETVTINGAAGRGVKVAGSTIVVAAPVGTDLFAAGQTVAVEPGARIGADAFIGATQASVASQVGGRLHAGGSGIMVTGSVQGETRLEAERVTFGSGARFAGPVSYVSANEATIAPDVQFAQPPQRSVPERPSEPQQNVVRDQIGGGVARFLILLGVGALVLWLVRRPLVSATRAIRHNALASFGVGVAVLFIPPIVIIILAILLGIVFGVLFGGGAWLAVLAPAIIGLGLWWLVVYLSPVVVGTWLGRWLLRLAGRSESVSPFIALALGLLLIVLVGYVPVLGGLINWLIVPIFGAGALVYAILERREAPPGAPATGATPVEPVPPAGPAAA